MKLFVYIILLTQLIDANDTYYCYGDKKISMTAVSNTTRSLSSIDFYKDENGHLLGVSDKLIVAFTKPMVIETFLQKYDIKIVSKLSSNSYLLKTDNKKETINIANTLNALPEVLYAHPDFIKKRFKR